LAARPGHVDTAKANLVLEPDSILLKTLMPAELPVQRFPSTVGRRRRDSEPDLPGIDFLIADRAPYRLSRRHFAIKRLGTKFVVMDDASKLCTKVNGITIGPFERSNVTQLVAGSNTIHAGGADSPYSFRVTVK